MCKKKKKARKVSKNLIIQSLQLAPCEKFLDSQLTECILYKSDITRQNKLGYLK